MSAEDVQKVSVAKEENKGGLFGAIKNTLGLGDSVSTPQKVVEKRTTVETTTIQTEEGATQVW